MSTAKRQRTGRTTKGGAAASPVGAAVPGSPAPERGPGVSPEERHRLAECCAFFMAERYRQAEPGKIRKHDVEAAEAELEAVIRKCCEQ